MKMRQYVDVLVPRGGAGLIKTIVRDATVPVIETGAGICHIYIDSVANLEKAEQIVLNAKTQRPSVCNALETLLVHEGSAPRFLIGCGEKLRQAGVEVRGCPETLHHLPWAKAATESDWSSEYLDLTLAIKVVPDLTAAVAHIREYGTGHSESIITTDYSTARRFLQEVDAAAVYVNASTRFTDGYEFGFGAELGISTQKLHARGPMGLSALTTIKYIIYGDGQIRT
jgi:glutamate-5-semialdehyde dehydrogenase